LRSTDAPGTAQRLQQAWLHRGAIAIALAPLSIVFGALTALRRLLYRCGWPATTTLRVPVVVVGNLIVGGAGKTPTVIAVVAALRRHGYTPGIVSRGYGGQARQVCEVTRDSRAAVCGDEPLLLHLRTDAPVVVAPDRVAAAGHLLRRHADVDIIVSDDGLQHLRLARDAQVLVFDERGAGNGWLLPAGPLREMLPRTLPPGTLVVYNAAAPTTPLPGVLARRALSGAVALADWWQGHPARAATLDALRGRTIVAAAGLARPERFFNMLRDRGLQIVALPLPDHDDFATLPWPAGTADVILTEKDAVKLAPDRAGATRVWVATLDFTLDAAFDAALIALLPRPGMPHGNATS
jgi:tetraacyldisaccharide 4'-kinase